MCTIVYLGKIRREKKRFFPSPFFFHYSILSIVPRRANENRM